MTAFGSHAPLVGRVRLTPVIPRTDIPFPMHIHLPLLNSVIDEVEHNIQAPRALIFGSALTAVALAQQGLIDVQKPNGQQVPTAIMTLTIGDSGERKSTAENAFLHPIREFEREQKFKHVDRIRSWQVAHDIWKTQRKALMKNIAKKASAGVPSKTEEQKLLDHEGKEPIKPKQFKILYEDSTSEALFHGLHKNLPTAGLISSEGGGVLEGPAMKDLAKQNALWSGDTITVDRKQSESFEIPEARLTVSLMMQSSSFYRYMEKRGEDSRGSGLWSRFLVGQPASTQGTRFIMNGTQSWEHREPFSKRIRELMERNTNLLDDHSKERQVVGFTPAASERWFEVANAIEAEIRPGGRFEFAGDHASKLADNITRLAAHFHWFEGFEGSISSETLELAISTCFWYSNEFLRLFVPPPQEEVDAEELSVWFSQMQMRGYRYIRKNHIRQYGPNRLRDRRRLQTALDLLQMNGRIGVFMLGKTTCVDLAPWLQFELPTAQAAIFGQMGASPS